MTPDDAAQRADLLRISLALDSAQVGSFDWDLRSGRLLWDDRLRTLVGHTDEDVEETIAGFDGWVHPDDQERVGRVQLAEELQRSLLTAPPEPDRAQVVRYLPAAQAAQVGGDWYDAFLQPDGTTTVVIGDDVALVAVRLHD